MTGISPDTIAVLQAAQGSAAGKESFAIILETRTQVTPTALEMAAKAILPIALAVEPLFAPPSPTTAVPDADLARFHRLRLTGVSVDALPGSPFDLAYALKDSLDLASAEPDLETEFYRQPEASPGTGPESLGDILDCWVNTPEPADRVWALRAMRVPQAWAYSAAQNRPAEGRGVSIAQPDTGVAQHVELQGALDFTRAIDLLDGDHDPTDDLISDGPAANPGHGTGTASVAVSRGSVSPSPAPEEGGVVGTAPQAILTPIRCIESVIRISQSNVAQAIEHARQQGCHVITMSLGGLPSAALKAALRRAVEDNIIVLAAAGNCVGWVVWPAAYDRCIAVGGTNAADRTWKGSCHGPQVDISAPAELVWRALRERTDTTFDRISGGQGTSFAVALTAGVAALWLAHHGRAAVIASLGPGERLQDRFRRLLMETARRPEGWDPEQFGAGIVDAETLLKRGPGTPGGAGPEAVHLGVSDTMSIARMLTGIVTPGAAPPSPEAAFRVGLSPGELERYGVELAWLAFKAKLVKTGRAKSPDTGLETLAAAVPPITPVPIPSAELAMVLARPDGAASLLAAALRP